MEELELLIESWKRDRELAEDCTCDIDEVCFFHLTDQEQMEERVKSLVSRLNSFCEDQGLGLSIWAFKYV